VRMRSPFGKGFAGRIVDELDRQAAEGDLVKSGSGMDELDAILRRPRRGPLKAESLA
jgi:hypothetical protein